MNTTVIWRDAFKNSLYCERLPWCGVLYETSTQADGHRQGRSHQQDRPQVRILLAKKCVGEEMKFEVYIKKNIFNIPIFASC